VQDNLVLDIMLKDYVDYSNYRVPIYVTVDEAAILNSVKRNPRELVLLHCSYLGSIYSLNSTSNRKRHRLPSTLELTKPNPKQSKPTYRAIRLDNTNLIVDNPKGHTIAPNVEKREHGVPINSV
jgi:hypothetical protein